MFIFRHKVTHYQKIFCKRWWLFFEVMEEAGRKMAEDAKNHWCPVKKLRRIHKKLPMSLKGFIMSPRV
jgi:hypothetical protein